MSTSSAKSGPSSAWMTESMYCVMSCSSRDSFGRGPYGVPAHHVDLSTNRHRRIRHVKARNLVEQTGWGPFGHLWGKFLPRGTCRHTFRAGFLDAGDIDGEQGAVPTPRDRGNTV